MALDGTAEKQFFYQWSHDGDGNDSEHIAAHGTESVLHHIREADELTTEVDEYHACHDKRDAQSNSLARYFAEAL